MAAEYESTTQTAEEISQLLYHLQVLMLAKGLTPRRRLPASLSRSRHRIRPRRVAAGPTERDHPMLRIAVPNKGSLAETAARCSPRPATPGRRDPRALTVADPRNGVEFFYLRPRDIATYVGSGALDVGITGRDLLLDSGSEAARSARSTSASSTFRFAAPPGTVRTLEDLEGRRVATSYPGLVGAFLAEHGVTARRSSGSTAPSSRPCGSVSPTPWPTSSRRARLCALRASRSSARSSSSPPPSSSAPSPNVPGIATLQRRLQGVLVARQYVLMDYDLPRELLDASAGRSRPGLESPTVSPLADTDWVAVRAMVPRDDDQPRHGRAVRPRRTRHPRQLRSTPPVSDVASPSASSRASTSRPAASSRA